MLANLFGPPKGGHYLLLLLLASGCSSSTTSPSATTTPSTFVMTWSSLAFPTTGVGRTSAAVAITLWNTGTAPVPVSSVTNSNAAEFPWTTTCQLGGTLAAASTCAVTVTFTPAALGDRTATLAINANSTTQTLTATGTGATVNPQVSISGAGDSAPTVFMLFVTGATPSGTVELRTVYTPAQGNPPALIDATRWVADANGAVTATVTTERPGIYEHWVLDLNSGLSTNHVFHAIP